MKLGKKELGVISHALACYLQDAVSLSKGEVAYVTKLQTKVNAARDRVVAPPLASAAAGPSGANVAPIHDALIAAAGGKVAPMATASPAWWARASKRLGAVGATVEGATKLGTWIQAQTWLTGVIGWDTILHKWEDWYARACATADSAASPTAGRRKAAW